MASICVGDSFLSVPKKANLMFSHYEFENGDATTNGLYFHFLLNQACELCFLTGHILVYYKTIKRLGGHEEPSI